MKKLADLRVVRSYDLALNLESEPVCSLQTQKIRSSNCYLPQHHSFFSFFFFIIILYNFELSLSIESQSKLCIFYRSALKMFSCCASKLSILLSSSSLLIRHSHSRIFPLSLLVVGLSLFFHPNPSLTGPYYISGTAQSTSWCWVCAAACRMGIL